MTVSKFYFRDSFRFFDRRFPMLCRNCIVRCRREVFDGPLPFRTVDYSPLLKSSNRLENNPTFVHSCNVKSADMDDQTCADEFSARVWRYNWLVALALVGVSGKLLLFRKHTRGWSNLVMGCIATAFAVSLLTVYWPSCPESCTCGDFFALFPFLSLLMGLGWIHDGTLAVLGYRVRNTTPSEDSRRLTTKGSSEVSEDIQ